MATVRLPATLILSIDAGPAQLWQDAPGRMEATATRVRDELAQAGIPATWGLHRVDPALVESLLAIGHEAALAAHPNWADERSGRGELIADLRPRLEALRRLGAPATTVLLPCPLDVDAQGDVLARQGVRALRMAATDGAGAVRGWRRWTMRWSSRRTTEPCDFTRPLALRWGMWGFQNGPHLGDISPRALRGMIDRAVQESSIAHLSFDLERLMLAGDDGQRAVQRLVDASHHHVASEALERQTIGTTATAIAAAWRPRPSQSILRRAA